MGKLKEATQPSQRPSKLNSNRKAMTSEACSVTVGTYHDLATLVGRATWVCEAPLGLPALRGLRLEVWHDNARPG